MSGPGKKKVLVVDDDRAQTLMISRFLEKHQFEVLVANDPLVALETVSAHADLKLVLTDLMMPHMHGIELTEKIHSLPNRKNLPVILMTAYTSDELADKGMRKGVAMTLSKPVSLAKLLDLVGFAVQ